MNCPSNPKSVAPQTPWLHFKEVCIICSVLPREMTVCFGSTICHRLRVWASFGFTLGTPVLKAMQEIVTLWGAGMDPSSMNSQSSKNCGCPTLNPKLPSISLGVPVRVLGILSVLPGSRCLTNQEGPYILLLWKWGPKAIVGWSSRIHSRMLAEMDTLGQCPGNGFEYILSEGLRHLVSTWRSQNPVFRAVPHNRGVITSQNLLFCRV